MATIEERALQYANGKIQSLGRKEGYIKGATEQRNIDIFKALEWIKNNLNCDTASFVWAMADFKKYMDNDI